MRFVITNSGDQSDVWLTDMDNAELREFSGGDKVLASCELVFEDSEADLKKTLEALMKLDEICDMSMSVSALFQNIFRLGAQTGMCMMIGESSGPIQCYADKRDE